jgi:hypothetical protein
VRGGDFLAYFVLVINPLGYWGRIPWGILGILLNRKGFPIKVTVIGHPLVTPIFPSLATALGKYRLCDNMHRPQSGEFSPRVSMGAAGTKFSQSWRNVRH